MVLGKLTAVHSQVKLRASGHGKSQTKVMLFFVGKSLFFIHNVSLLHNRPKMAGNVLALGAVADFRAQNYQNTTKVDAR